MRDHSSQSDPFAEILHHEQPAWKPVAIPDSGDASMLTVLRGCDLRTSDPGETEALQHLADNIDMLPLRIDLDSLCDWEGRKYVADTGLSVSLRKVLFALNPESIVETGGVDPLVWAHLQGEVSGIRVNHNHCRVLQQFGFSAQRLFVCGKAAPEIISAPNRSATALLTYETGTILLNDGRLETDIAQYVRSGRQLTARELALFELGGVTINSGHPCGSNHRYGRVSHTVENGGEFRAFFLDAPLGIVLCYDSQPVAFGAALADSPQSVLINELQAIKSRRLITGSHVLVTEDIHSHRWEIEPIDWKRMLVDAFSRVAQAAGAEEIGIQSAYNNAWTKPDRNGSVHLPLARAQRIYDDLALRMGMTRRSDGNYFSRLSPPG